MHRNVNALINYIYINTLVCFCDCCMKVCMFELFYFLCITDREREEGGLMLVGIFFLLLVLFCYVL